MKSLFAAFIAPAMPVMRAAPAQGFNEWAPRAKTILQNLKKYQAPLLKLHLFWLVFIVL